MAPRIAALRVARHGLDRRLRAAQAELLHFDVLPETFTDALGWTRTKRGRAVRALHARGLIIPGVGQLQTTHWTDGRNVRVYRIKGEFFEE